MSENFKRPVVRMTALSHTRTLCVFPMWQEGDYLCAQDTPLHLCDPTLRSTSQSAAGYILSTLQRSMLCCGVATPLDYIHASRIHMCVHVPCVARCACVCYIREITCGWVCIKGRFQPLSLFFCWAARESLHKYGLFLCQSLCWPPGSVCL